MGSGTFVCLLVILACHVTLCLGIPALVTGNCTLEEVPEDAKNRCWRTECINYGEGVILAGGIGCATGFCGEDVDTKLGPSDMTKTFPDCCPTIICE